MIYVFDSNSLIDLFKHYYSSRFPSLWEKFDALVLSGKITSVREVANEITQWDDRLSDWTKSNKAIFPISSPDELRIVADIFRNNHFQANSAKRSAFRVKPLRIHLLLQKQKLLKTVALLPRKLLKNMLQRLQIYVRLSMFLT